MERADRNVAELLQELRVTQTGIQILFAFLLTLAFSPRFPSLDAVQGGTCVTTPLLAVLGLWGVLPRQAGRRNVRRSAPRQWAASRGVRRTGARQGSAIHTVLPPSSVGLTESLPPHSAVSQRMITMPRPLSCWTAAGRRLG